jgi:ubiquinol-cytochrome c reductase cytochrome c subunit
MTCNANIYGTVHFMALLTLAIWLCGSPRALAQQSSGNPAGKVNNGKQLYNDIGCWQCHGYEGQGGAGPELGPNPISYPSFKAYIRHPRGQMPPYSEKVVTDQQLADIHAFLETIPASPDADSIPLLKEDE